MGKWKSCCDKPLADLGLSSKALIRCPRPDLLPVTRNGTVLINAVPRVQVQGQILDCGDCLFVPGFVRTSTLHFTLLFPTNISTTYGTYIKQLRQHSCLLVFWVCIYMKIRNQRHHFAVELQISIYQCFYKTDFNEIQWSTDTFMHSTSAKDEFTL